MIATILYSTAGLEASCGNDPAFIKQIVEMSAAQMLELSEQITNFTAKKDWPNVYFHAHKLKASIDLLEVVSLKEEIRALEKNAKHEVNIDEILSQAKHVAKVVEECVKQMKGEA